MQKGHPRVAFLHGDQRHGRYCGVVVILAHAKRGSEWLEALGD